MAKQVAAVDIGGTKLMVGLVDETGAVLRSKVVPTPIAGGPEAVVDAAVQLLADLDGRPAALGATVPGLADSRRGLLRYAPAHGWSDVPFAEMLSRASGLPARIANDVNACALAEQRFGVGKGMESLVWITVSTGIGGAVVIKGQIFEGAGGISGEIGHLVVEEGGPACGCGHLGCLEAVASGPAIARRAGMGSAAQVFEAARQGSPAARTVVRETAFYLGRAAAFVQNILDPDAIVFGGGVARSFDLLKPDIERALRQRAILLPDRPPVIRTTALGYEAALIGAAALVL